jgi:glycosyltransferase involved in cell wall biosynthesis
VYCLVPAAGQEERIDAERVGVRLLTAARIQGEEEREALMHRPDLPMGLHPDMIIGHGRVTGFAARAQRRNYYPDAAYLHVIHTSPDDTVWYQPDEKDPVGRAEEKRKQELALAREATRVLAVGPQLLRLAKDYVRRNGGALKPIQIDPGFDTAPERPGTPTGGGTKQVVIVGRLDDGVIKGLDLAAQAVGEALRQLRSDGEDIQLVLRGVPDGKGQQLHDDVQRWSGWPHLRVVPRSYSASVEDLDGDLREATLVLMPSRAEGFGLVGVEAIVAGTPVLISGRSGLGELLQHVSPDKAKQVVLPIERDQEEDTKQWARAIDWILRDTDAAFTRASSLRDTMRGKRTWAMAAKQVLEAWPVSERRTARRQLRLPSHLQAFICYAEDDGREFAHKLQNKVRDMIDRVYPWTDIDPEHAHLPHTEAVDWVLRRTAVVLFVLTRESGRATNTNWRVGLLTAAQERAVPIVVLRKDRNVSLPILLPDARELDFTGDKLDGAWQQLARELERIGTEEHEAEDAGSEPVAHPRGGASDETATGDSTSRHEFKVINDMPLLSSATFRDREPSMRWLQSTLEEEAVRLVVLEGQNGVGKTALLRTLRDQREQGLSTVGLNAFVYFSARGQRWITVPTLLADLACAVPDTRTGQNLQDLVRKAPWRQALGEVLAELRGSPVAVVVDDADALFDTEGAWRDRELRDLVTALAERDGHRVILIMSMTQRVQGLTVILPLRRGTRHLNLEREGLPRDDANKLLRELDDDRVLGVAAASDAQLERLHQLTGDHPRALELIVGLLRARDVTVDSLPDLVGETPTTPDALLTLIFDELRPRERRVMQALAIFARPVPPAAVTYLLKEMEPYLRTEAVLARLARMFLIYRYGSHHYYVPPAPDAKFVLSTLLSKEYAGQSSALAARLPHVRPV